MPSPKPSEKTTRLLVQREMDKQIRGEAALAHRVLGRSYKEIGDIFGATGESARKWVAAAKNSDALLRAKGVIGERLVPKALAVYDRKLEEGDLEAARDVLFGAGLLQKNAKVTVEAGDPLDAFRRKYFGEPDVEGEVVKVEEVHE